MSIKNVFNKIYRVKKGNVYWKHEHFLVVAHRGAAGYAPENTMAAFRKAVELKADFIELDIQMSKDGELVVIHDPTVDRTTNGVGEIRNLTYNEIKQLDAGKWFHKNFSGEKVPTLQEVLTEFSGKISFLIEIKNPNLYPEIVEKLTNILSEKQQTNDIIVQSFDFELLEKVHQQLPTLKLGLLVKYRIHGISNVQLKDWSKLVQYINPNKALITKNLVKRIHSYKMRVMPYTVRDKKSIKGLLDSKIDGVITDFPDYFIEE
ncbi:glycerophosphodiester phosphodiesterase [Metabacillus niabensis]|uniref:glycerophosphodiester phosphodiesterase n=1 Tax=Metabacillus niabensis TaxID=324854 RepID=UPI0039A26AED